MQLSTVMLMPTLARYMTRKPWTIDRTAKMTEAHRLMREHQIRHLPVVDGDRVVGIVSMRDLHLLETLPGVSPDEVDVEDAMSTELFVASESDELADIVERMVEARVGSAVVMDPQGLVGIFTSVDAMRALADILRREST
jgi:acetoin utilization protein AcuB